MGSDSASLALLTQLRCSLVLGSRLPPANFPSSDATGCCADSLGSLPQGSERELKSRKAIGRAALLPPWGQGLPGAPAPCSAHTVACTAGAALSPLPELEGKLSALQSKPGAAWGLGSRRAREQSRARLPVPRKGEGGCRSRQSGLGEGPGQLGPELV